MGCLPVDFQAGSPVRYAGPQAEGRHRDSLRRGQGAAPTARDEAS